MVIIPNPKNRLLDEAEDQFLARVWARNVETAAQKDKKGNVVNPHLTVTTPFKVVDVADLPADRADRAAWKLDADRVAVDPVKAQALRTK